jgi:hypothetical protein
LLFGGNNPTAAMSYEEQVQELETELTTHLRDRRLNDQDNQRLLNGVGAQHDSPRFWRDSLPLDLFRPEESWGCRGE